MEILSQFSSKELPVEYIRRKFYTYGNDPIYLKEGGMYLCGCPICHEGKSWGKKRRCYYFPDKNFFYCFNCGKGYSPFNWIKQAGGLSADDIRREVFGGNYNIINLDAESSYSIKTNFADDVVEDIFGIPTDSIELFPLVNKFLKNKLSIHNSVIKRAVDYIIKRRLHLAVNRPDKLFISLKDKIHSNRIIFPFYDFNMKIPFFQSRAIGVNDAKKDVMENVRYLSKVGFEKSVFNINKISPEIDDIYIFEGPIDSCFVRNGVAVAGVSKGDKLDLTDLQRSQLSPFSLTHRFVWVLDNQSLDETSREKTLKLIQSGQHVFIWPKSIKYKDFNEWAISENLNEIPIEIIKNNIYCGERDTITYMFNKFFEKACTLPNNGVSLYN